MGETRLYRNFCSNTRYSQWKITVCKRKLDISRSLALFCIWEDGRIWTRWNHSFDMHLSYLGPVSYFLILSFLNLYMGVTAVWWLLDGGHSLFLPCVLPGLTVGGWLLSLMAQNSLLTEMAGSILFLTPNISFTLAPLSNYSECVKKKKNTDAQASTYTSLSQNLE